MDCQFDTSIMEHPELLASTKMTLTLFPAESGNLGYRLVDRQGNISPPRFCDRLNELVADSISLLRAEPDMDSVFAKFENFLDRERLVTWKKVGDGVYDIDAVLH